MSRYRDTWKTRQLIRDPERFTVHQPPHGTQEGFSEVELQATAPETDLLGLVDTDAVVDRGVAAHPIDRTPSQGGRGRDWTRADSGAGIGGVTRSPDRYPGGTPAGSAALRQSVVGSQAAARGRDYGAGTYGTHAFQPHGDHGEMHGEQRATVLVTGLETTPLANQGGGWEQYRRGLNADPLNDGAANGGSGTEPRPTAWRVGEDDGSLWRPARYLRTVMDRIFKPTRQLPTDQVMINPVHTPQIIVNAPPPAKPSKGGELFASLAKFVPKAVPVAGLARTPQPWYRSAEADAPLDDPAELPDYSGVYIA